MIQKIIHVDRKNLIIVCDFQQELINFIDNMSDGKYLKLLQEYEDSKLAGKPLHGKQKEAQKIALTQMAWARVTIGEKKLINLDTYSIKSPNDPKYLTGRMPVGSDMIPISTGEPTLFGGFDPSWVNYCMIRLPSMLQPGCDYTINVLNQSISFKYDDSCISYAIKVNQEGYLLNTTSKVAFIGAHLYNLGPLEVNSTRFAIIEEGTGKKVFNGDVVLVEDMGRFSETEQDPTPLETKPLISGEKVYRMDFSTFNRPGVYHIKVPNVGRSFPFKVGSDALDRAWYISERHFYHQRASQALEQPYTAWTRPQGHVAPIYYSEHIQPSQGYNTPTNYFRFDVIGATTDPNKILCPDRVGGLYDAADWDSICTHYIHIFDQLHLYEKYPHKFTDGQLNIPESGNGIPDTLDQIEYELRIWLKSQNEKGGVSGQVETWTHTRFDDDAKFTFSVPLRPNSLLFAAAASLYSRLVRPFNEELADKYLVAAKKAWTFGNDPTNRFEGNINAALDRGRGEPYTVFWSEPDKPLDSYIIMAGSELYLTTGDMTYLVGLKDKAYAMKKGASHETSHWIPKKYEAWYFYSFLKPSIPIFNPEERSMFIDYYYKNFVEAQLKYQGWNAYKASWQPHRSFWMSFGACDMTNKNRAIGITYLLTDDPRYMEAMLLNLNYMMGANPLGMSWTTGIGQVYPIKIQHATSADDGILDPVPGISLYGIDEAPTYTQFKNKVWRSPIYDPTGATIIGHEVFFDETRPYPMFRRYSAHESFNTSQCEFTVGETSAARSFTLGFCLKAGFMPSADLKGMQPKPKDKILGFYPLP